MLTTLFLVFLFGYGCEPSQGNGTATEDSIKLPPLAQVGVVVRSVDKAVAHYTRLGLAPSM